MCGWCGFLRLQLVSINVDISAATESASEIHFNQIDKPSGKRMKKWCPASAQVHAWLFTWGRTFADDNPASPAGTNNLI
jgi:hypothetical protein